MSENQFNENSKEKLEKEIEELRKQKEIKDLQRQKEELEKEVFGGNNEEIVKNMQFYEAMSNEKNTSNRLIVVLATVVAVIIFAFIGGIFYLRSQNKKKSEKLRSEMATIQTIPAVTTPQVQTAPTTQAAEEKKSEKPKEIDRTSKSEEKQERLIVRKPIDVRKGSYCVNPSSSQSYFNTTTVSDPNADNPYMADIHFSDCVVYGTHSEGTYNGRHTGPITMTVSLPEEKNFDAVMNRSKWYLENGEITRIEGYDYSNVYFNGWLMYKQTP